MRPGPGLVVMALAFISGARRGSTSTSSKSSSSTTTSSPSTDHEPLTPSILFPEYLGGGNVLTVDTNTFPSYPQQEAEGKKYRVDYYNHLYNIYSYLSPFVPPIHKKTHEDQHLRLETLSGLKSSSRATRQTRIIRSLNVDERSQIEQREYGGENAEISENVSKQGNPVGSEIGSGYEIEDGIISVEYKTGESSASAGTSVSEASKGLPILYRSNSADTSRSFDDDDILALVAEDDLLSEESFDRLTKFTDDKVGYLIVDDYDATSKDSTNGVSESSIVITNENRQQQTHDVNYTVNENSSAREQGSGESDEIQNEQEHSTDKNQANVGNKIKHSVKRKVLTENEEYKHASLGAVADISYVAAFSENGLSHTVPSIESDSRVRNTKWSIFESESPLTRLNPWISACDLAQPGTAPDLQGQCSAGTLPMAWVDEGPGPPSCPISCEKLKPSIVNNFNTEFNNNDILVKNNDVNFKTPTNNHYDTETMSRVRRDLSQWAGNDSNKISDDKQQIDISGTKITESSVKAMANSISATPVQVQQTANTVMALTLTRGDRQHQANNYKNVKVNKNQTETSSSNGYSDILKYESNAGRLYNNKQKKQYNSYREQMQPKNQQKHQKQQQQKEQQCLDYLGDTEETSPAHLCTFKSHSELADKLRSLRLRHCCERNVFSALHTVALNATLSGGVECVRILMDVMDLDLLATRITCELAEILFRFDCRQVYSLIHQCDDCKEAYRRWVCSTLVPYFAEESDISVSRRSDYSNNNSKSGNSINNTSTKDNDKTIVDVSTNNKIGQSFPNENNNNKLYYAANSVQQAMQRNKRQLNRSLTFSNSSPTESSTSENNYNVAVMKRNELNMGGECNQQQQQEWRQGQQNPPKQSNIFIPTAINADPCAEDPVISIIKRSKRKVQFRKRKRIRPCLSVCQTVEQKCPYLLPADRAPALPTQYAGEPTFLCLDQSIPETGEQLRKSSYGPAECCYGYCNDVADGICAFCSEFTAHAMNENIVSGNLTRRLHNITLTATSQYRLDARIESSLGNDSTNKLAASISIALSNSSDTGIGGQIDRLTYYALYDGIYYYDENTDDMPEVALSDDCPPVPSVTNRCSIPYYASSAVAIHTKQNTVPNNVIGHHMLLLLSAMLCLLTTKTAVMQLQKQIDPNQKQLRKQLRHSTKLNIDSRGLASRARHKESTVIYVINISMHLVVYRTQYLQQLVRAEYTASKREFRKSTERGFALRNPSMPTIFPKSTICVYFSKGSHDSEISQNGVHKWDRRLCCSMEKNFRRNKTRCSGRNKNKRREGNRKWKLNRNRKRPVSRNEITDKHCRGRRSTISQICSLLNRSKERKNISTEYNYSLRNNHAQFNLGNNKITYILNSKLYFNSNIKIYRRRKSSTFRNFNIATITDYNKHHIKRIIQAITSNDHKNNYNYIYKCNFNYNNIEEIHFSNMENNFHFIYYYNFNINDWWRRWWWCIMDRAEMAQRVPSVIL